MAVSSQNQLNTKPEHFVYVPIVFRKCTYGVVSLAWISVLHSKAEYLENVSRFCF
jgi:hypothetical protein